VYQLVYPGVSLGLLVVVEQSTASTRPARSIMLSATGTVLVDPHFRLGSRSCLPLTDCICLSVLRLILTWGKGGIFMKGHKLKAWWCSEKGVGLNYEAVILTIVPMYGKRASALEVVYILSRRKLAAVCLGGSQSDLLLCTPHRTNAVESSDLPNRLQIYSHSVGKLKSLYEYLIGKHIHKLIRKSVPYTCSPWVELGLYVGLLTSSVRLWKAA